MAVLHIGSLSWFQTAALFVWVLAMKCAAMTTAEMEQWIGAKFVKSMEHCDITVKAAAAANGMDESTFRNCLRAEAYRHLTSMHAVRLGPLFMVHFSA